MGEGSFNEEKILSLEDIIKGVHLKIDKAFAELTRRDEVKDEYYDALFRLEKPSERLVLRVLKESGGAHRFTDILRKVGGSSSTLAKALKELRDKWLVRIVSGGYQASSPAWFAQKKREQKRIKL